MDNEHLLALREESKQYIADAGLRLKHAHPDDQTGPMVFSLVLMEMAVLAHLALTDGDVEKTLDVFVDCVNKASPHTNIEVDIGIVRAPRH